MQGEGGGCLECLQVQVVRGIENVLAWGMGGGGGWGEGLLGLVAHVNTSVAQSGAARTIVVDVGVASHIRHRPLHRKKNEV